MAKYKCINCGKSIDSERDISCPDCGFRMFLAPYERKDLLVMESVRFLKNLRLNEIKSNSLYYYRAGDKTGSRISIEKDNERFPSIDKIHKYAESCEKTSVYCERVYQILSQIRGHIHEKHRQEYLVDFNYLKSKLEAYDKVLVEVCKISGIDWTPSEVLFPNTKVEYMEFPDKELVGLADKVLNAAESLLGKYADFIKMNNLYNDTHMKPYHKTLLKTDDKSYVDILDDCLKNANAVINKEYYIDFMDDGQKEVKEILSVLWLCINVVLDVPVLAKSYIFFFENGNNVDSASISDYLCALFESRYEAIDSAIDSGLFQSMSEEALASRYIKFVALDEFKILRISDCSFVTVGEGEKKLHSLIGLEPVKNSINKIKAYVATNKNSGDLNLHMCFYGNPGTGKTEVARIIAEILYENKILKSPKVIEVDRSDLVGQYLGETPIKTLSKIKEAMGGVLFIDEAYALIPKGSAGYDYGHEAIATLIKAMEDYRGRFCVILAGYRTEMLNMIATNPGFKSRIQFELEFPNYSRDELGEIAKLMISSKDYEIDDISLDRMMDITDIKRKDPHFANAREVRNMVDQIIMCQNLRCRGENHQIGLVDVNRYIEDNSIILTTKGSKKNRKALTGDEELEELIGLDQVKKMVKKIRAYSKKNSDTPNFNIHMCFYGNPGTGKTEVARIMSRILYDAGVLKEAKIVETDAYGLIGKYVGETAPKTLEIINKATGGVLFIDEAYALAEEKTTQSFGEEAIAVLLKEMEDRRGSCCVILAGYKNEMRNMISCNPGLESRIQFALDFPDYKSEELEEITRVFACRRGYLINDEALKLIIRIADSMRNKPNFANARTIRNILDQVIMNQNLRTENERENYNILTQDVEEYISDEGIDVDNPESDKPKFGFV